MEKIIFDLESGISGIKDDVLHILNKAIRVQAVALKSSDNYPEYHLVVLQL